MNYNISLTLKEKNNYHIYSMNNNNNMKISQLKSLIRESIKEVLNENYRGPNENLDELLMLLNKNKTKDAITLIQSVQSRLEDDDLETAFDEAVEELLDKGNRGYFYDSSGRSLS